MMFYTQLFTSKRGPLAKIWLAAHWERKITKAHVFDCNLESTIRYIISPEMKIGLRTSGHLLLGVVRIYFRKTKYLLADCNDALAKVKVAFRPGNTDMPFDGLEATLKAITLIEDFTDFDTQLPHPNNIDVVDHFSLNRARTEEITLKEDFGDVSHCHQSGLLDMSFQSLAHQEDHFGDEDTGFDLLDDTRLDAMEVEPPTLCETTLLSNEEEGFALEPVAVTFTADKKGKRKRGLVVDQIKELTNEAIREQLADFSDLVAPLDMAPPTRQLMQWKENGGAARLFGHFCSTVINSQMQQEFFTKSNIWLRSDGMSKEGDLEQMREDRQEVQGDASILTAERLRVLDESVDHEKMRRNSELISDNVNDNQPENPSETPNDASRLEFSYPELPSEDSMFVHPSGWERESQSTIMHNQSMLDSQAFEENRITRRVQKLLDTLKSQSTARFSLKALCERSTHSQAASTFFCFLVLKKLQALHLHQDKPYDDILATPGPRFHDL
ncbi:double-strand-break repair protein rad21-like protein 1 [Polymixia lowei]